jgi:hypothetical protein
MAPAARELQTGSNHPAKLEIILHPSAFILEAKHYLRRM